VQPARAQDRVLLQLDWIPTGEHAAYFAGAARGAWREQGIDLSLTRGYGSGDTVNKVAAGTAAFGVADISAVMAARARQNTPVRAIMQIYTHSPHSLFVLRSSGITNFQIDFSLVMLHGSNRFWFNFHFYLPTSPIFR
jgi:NitT/TauT family transport system substrate-binding protein